MLIGLQDPKPPLHSLAERSEWGSFRFNLEAMRAALVALGHPEQCFRHLLVGGTNGKGTVALNLALSLPGKVGLFHSPHLWDVRERISINGKIIEDVFWQAAEGEWLRVAGQIELSYFELTLVIAVLLFRRLEVDWAVFEVGVGGRLDAVNALQPELSVLTQVSLDHQALLGTTESEIALEKIEIARAERVLILPDAIASMPQVEKRLREIGCKTKQVVCENRFEDNLKITNAALAALGLAELKRLKASLNGRRECLNKEPLLIVDGAHNRMGWVSLAAWIRELHGERQEWNLVLGLSVGRDPLECLKSFSDLKTRPMVWLSGFERELKQDAWPKGTSFLNEAELSEILGQATLVCGSLYHVGRFRKWWYMKQKRVSHSFWHALDDGFKRD